MYATSIIIMNNIKTLEYTQVITISLIVEHSFHPILTYVMLNINCTCNNIMITVVTIDNLSCNICLTYIMCIQMINQCTTVMSWHDNMLKVVNICETIMYSFYTIRKQILI